MEARINTGFRVGILAVACMATVLPLVGCQPSDQMAVSPTNPACPLCGGPTQAQPPAGLSCTRVVCPICGQVSTVDPEFLDSLEGFIGGPVGDTVYACASCKAIVEQCAACWQRNGSLTSRDTRSWQ